MERTPIAELKPDLVALESRELRAIVTLLWPYSSSARHFALLLGEPNFRLRRRNGQVRARFTGSSAKAVASTGIGIGDELVLGLRGAEFMQDSPVGTPGKSIDWELVYAQTLSVRITRNGNELAHLDLDHVALTPVTTSPGPPGPVAVLHLPGLDEAPKWPSPAFVRRTRLLSEGPVFEAGYDPFTHATEDRHDRKRRRKSYKDWNAWTYSARTPSPQKEDADMEDYNVSNSSPVRPMELPATPVHSPKPDIVSEACLPSHNGDSCTSDDKQAREHTTATETSVSDLERAGNQSSIAFAKYDFVRDADYYDLYAGPNELPPDNENMFEEDTNLDIEEAYNISSAHNAGYDSVIDVESGRSEGEVDASLRSNSNEVAVGDNGSEATVEGVASPVEYQRIVGVEEKADWDNSLSKLEHEQRFHEQYGAHDELKVLDDAPQNLMPSLNFPLLQTDFHFDSAPSLLTPIGKELRSPDLRPLDSSTLSMPSPFPGEPDGQVISYLEHFSSVRQVEVVEQQLGKEADHIVESSFYSSVSAADLATFHPTHESAFTDVRFPFGVDGSSYSRPARLSATGEMEDLSAEKLADDVVNVTDDRLQASNKNNMPCLSNVVFFEQAQALPTALLGSQAISTSPPQQQPNVIRLSSDSEPLDPEDAFRSQLGPDIVEANTSVDSAVDQDFHPTTGKADQQEMTLESHEIVRDNVHRKGKDEHGFEVVDEKAAEQNARSPSTRRSTAAAEMIDLSSASEDVSAAESLILKARLTAPRMRNPEGDHELDKVPFSGEALYKISSASPSLSAEDAGSSNEPQSHQSTAHTTVDNGNRAKVSHAWKRLQNETSRLDENYSQANVSLDQHPDIKMESIEEYSPSIWTQRNSSPPQKDDEGVVAGPIAELLIAVPEEGHKIGELHLKSVSATGPARNTRSKTKTLKSPVKDKSPELQRTSRLSQKPQTPSAPITRMNRSPIATASISTMSPTKDAMSTPPYSLRSQSKFMSPTQATTSSAQHHIPREHHRQRSSVQEYSRIEISPKSFHSDDLDSPNVEFAFSQELGASQGNLSYVKDSEEGSVHSEHSLSTNQYSDDWDNGTQTYTSLNKPAGSDMQLQDYEKASPIIPQSIFCQPSPLKTQHKATPQVEAIEVTQQLVHESPTQSPQRDPSKAHRSMTPIEIALSNPRSSRWLKNDVYDAPTHGEDSENAAPQGAPENGAVADSVFLAEGERGDVRSSFSAIVEVVERAPVHANDGLASSPPAVQSNVLFVNQQSLAKSNLLITPEAIQQTFADSLYTLNGQQVKDLSMSPQPVQNTAELHSFELDAEVESVAREPKTSVSKITLKRNAPNEDVVARSPRLEFADVSDQEPASGTQVDPPSIGLSTPIAYYTPLKDLPFFFNRSSQFHSSSNPDILALVTSSTTPFKKADKGPKHWKTTLHITDLSSYPASTTVQVFRPYVAALPVAQKGDVILLRSFGVKSLHRHPTLISGDESAWCVWKYDVLLWGKKRGAFSEVRAREEVKGPVVEKGEGEWREVESLRKWYTNKVKRELEKEEAKATQTRSIDKQIT